MKYQVTYINLEHLVPTVDNARDFKGFEKSPEGRSLADSIKEVGVLEPLLVRKHPADKGKFEIRAGERRFRASRMAGLKAVPCIVREMDDKEAMAVTVIENLQREDLNPMEEARGVRTLVAAGKSIQEVADALGKAYSWVVRVAKLNDLIPEWQEAVLGHGEAFETWGIGHFLLIARFPEGVQKGLFQDLQGYGYRNLTASGLAEQLAELTRAVKLAPWDTGNVNMGDLPSCQACVKRSGACPGLFDDLKENYHLTDKDLCLDPECWGKKTAIFLEAKYTELKDQHPTLVKISEEFNTEDPGILPSGRWEKSNKSAEGALPALPIDGKHLGKLIFIRLVRETQPSNRPERERDAAGNVKPLPLATRREQYHNRRKASIIRKLMEALKASTTPETPKYDYLIRLCVNFGCVSFPYDYQGARGLEYLSQPLPELRDGLFKELHTALKPNLLKHLRFLADTKVQDEKEAAFLLSLYGYSWETEMQKATEEHPYPKSWESLNEDGTPKQKEEQKAAA